MGAPTSPVLTDSMPRAVSRQFKKYYIETGNLKMPKLSRVFKESPQVDWNEYETDFQGVGQHEATGELETFKSDGIGEAYQTIYTPVKKTKKVQLSWEVGKYDKSAITRAAKLGTELAASATDTIETDGANVLNNAFDTDYTSYGDGKPLASTQHLRADGGTSQSNASSTGITFGDDNLETAQVAFAEQKNHRGRLISGGPTKLYLPRALLKKGLIVCKSQGRSNTADNDLNVYNNMREYKDGSLDIVCWDYMGAAAGGSDTAWFLAGPGAELNWKWGLKPLVKEDITTGLQNDSVYFLSKYQYSVGWSNWLHLWGSAGDGAAYSS